MKIEKLLLGVNNCKCGKKHTCPIDDVIIEKDALNKLSCLCKDYKNIVLVSDKNTYKACGEKVYSIIKEKVQSNLILKENGKVVIPNEEKIAEIQNEINESTDLVIGVGSGVINDLCKIVSFDNDLPYFIVATSPSMDGYASVGSALILNGVKAMKNARPPKALIADTLVLKDAPIDMIRAGYGDIIGKFSCLNDWKLSALINDEYFCQFVYDITYKTAKSIKGYAKRIAKRDEKAIGALMQALVIVGIAMSYVKTSRPGSGSEHHLSHFFEITGIIEGTEYFAHGIDVAYSSVETAKIREKLINSKPREIKFDREDWIKNLKRIYRDTADELIALQDKLGWYEKNDYQLISSKWNRIKRLLKKSPKPAQFIKMLDRVGLSYSEFIDFYGEEKIKDACLYGKDLKDRYSVLWLNYSYFRNER